MKPRSSSTLSGRSCSGSKTAPPPLRAARLARIAGRPARTRRRACRPRGEAAVPRAARARACRGARPTMIPTSASGTSSPSFSTCADTSARSSPARKPASTRSRSRPADLAGERHDQVFARDPVGGLVVRDEDQRSLGAVSGQQERRAPRACRRGNARIRRARRQAAIPRRPSSVRAAWRMKSSHDAPRWLPRNSRQARR